ncbi:hypothetical protein MPH_00701 [Macrophomina phaseolina MS6]|uniref:Short-chain dehydrogenase/reductase SDR n=1 Tax=Macrophomina phaseolina (strain MS6) TaxID=1126212 RepID=K2SA64_MACPH|nr:hypothetical protein MPH_00701 [Macrophomina phaseolina MS6]
MLCLIHESHTCHRVSSFLDKPETNINGTDLTSSIFLAILRLNFSCISSTRCALLATNPPLISRRRTLPTGSIWLQSSTFFTMASTGSCRSRRTTARSSQGIGYHVAQQLAIKGARVYIGARAHEKAEDAIRQMRKEATQISDSQLLPFVADFADLRSVHAGMMPMFHHYNFHVPYFRHFQLTTVAQSGKAASTQRVPAGYLGQQRRIVRYPRSSTTTERRKK